MISSKFNLSENYFSKNRKPEQFAKLYSLKMIQNTFNLREYKVPRIIRNPEI
ncbi:hypothetical protein GCM10027164_12770 [Algoriphagus taiwanensis]